MGQYVFLTALALVSALALALVYGLGGWLAIRGSLEPGTVVTLALLLTQLYAPLTALASARVERHDRHRQLRAGVRGPGPAPAHHREARCGRCARGAGVGRVRRRALRLPERRAGVAGVAGGGGDPRHPGRDRGAARRVVPGGAGPDGGAGGHLRQRQVDDRRAGPASTTWTRGRCASAGSTSGTCPSTPSARRSAWSPRTATCSTTPCGRTCASPGRRPPTRTCGPRCGPPGSPLIESLPDGLDTVVGERGYRFSGASASG